MTDAPINKLRATTQDKLTRGYGRQALGATAAARAAAFIRGSRVFANASRDTTWESGPKARERFMKRSLDCVKDLMVLPAKGTPDWRLVICEIAMPHDDDSLITLFTASFDLRRSAAVTGDQACFNTARVTQHALGRKAVRDADGDPLGLLPRVAAVGHWLVSLRRSPAHTRWTLPLLDGSGLICGVVGIDTAAVVLTYLPVASLSGPRRDRMNILLRDLSPPDRWPQYPDKVTLLDMRLAIDPRKPDEVMT